VLAIIAGVFCGTYYFIINKSLSTYEKSIKTEIDNINKTNGSITSFNKDKSIDPNKIKKELPSKVDSLLKEKDIINGINPTEKYKKAHASLLEGLNANILMYKQVQAILENSQSKDAASALEDLKKYKNNCVQAYSLVNIKSISASFPTDASSTMETIISYFTDMVKVNRDNDIKQSVNLEFMNNMDSIMSKLIVIKVDLSANVAKVRAGSGSYAEVLSKVDENYEKLQEIQKDYANITIPQKASSTYKVFKNVLDSYDSYLKNFKYAVTTEKDEAAKGKPSEDFLTSLYATSSSNLQQGDKSYNDFIKLYSDFKSNNIK
jgi:hypothetical protein